MIRVPLSAVPDQTLAITLAGQACQIALRSNGGNLYFDLTAGGVSIVRTRIVRNKQLLLLDARYRPFVGDFLFNDTQGDTQPVFTELDSRYVLYYVEEAELAAL